MDYLYPDFVENWDAIVEIITPYMDTSRPESNYVHLDRMPVEIARRVLDLAPSLRRVQHNGSPIMEHLVYTADSVAGYCITPKRWDAGVFFNTAWYRIPEEKPAEETVAWTLNTMMGADESQVRDGYMMLWWD